MSVASAYTTARIALYCTPRSLLTRECTLCRYNNDVFVYDTRRNRFGRAVGTSQHDPGLILPGCGAFPINDNLPREFGSFASVLSALPSCRHTWYNIIMFMIVVAEVNVLNDSIFAVGGECNDRAIEGQSYGHYPPLAAVGKLTALSE